MENKKINENASASLVGHPSNVQGLSIHGVYTVECHDAEGNVKWTAEAPNHVMTEGTNLLLDTGLEGSSYTAAVYMGLISSQNYTTTAVGDTAAQIGGTNQWDEAGSSYTPTYSGTRKLAAFSAASGGAISLSSALSFTFTGAGTVKGCFLIYGSGASSTIENTAGTLFSAGVFTGGDKVVANTDVLNVSYTVTITDT
jgi:hypothetical protein